MLAHKGFGLIEIVIAAAIVGMAITSLSYILVLSNKLSTRSSDEIRANFVAEEGIEAVRFLRDKGWSNISSTGNYYVSLNTTSGQWAISTTDYGPIGSVFSRTINIAPVNRDTTSGNIDSMGTLDSNTLKITSTVTWQYGIANVETYLSNIFNN